jgi:hypothetical protein
VHPESAIRAVPGKGEQFCAVWGGHFVWEVLMVAFPLREAKVVCLFFFLWEMLSLGIYFSLV